MACAKKAWVSCKKKTKRYKERDKQKRLVYTKEVEGIEAENLVYLDESGLNEYASRSYGWAPRGKKIYGDVQGTRFHRESFIAAQCKGKILAPICFTGTCNTQLFNMWLERYLVPELKPGQVIIMDNAAFHKSERTKQIIEEAGCRLLYLPPYSPDFNPIEKFWANLKYKINNIAHNFSTIQQAIDHAFNNYHS